MRIVLARLVLVRVPARYCIGMGLRSLRDDTLGTRGLSGSDAIELGRYPRAGGDAWSAQRHEGCQGQEQDNYGAQRTQRWADPFIMATVPRALFVNNPSMRAGSR